MKKLLFILLFFVPVITQGQIITTIAGNGIQANTGEGGAATAASFNYPTKILFDKSGNYYLGLGAYGKRIRKIDASGIMTNFAGTGASAYSGDGGPATAATFAHISDLAFDSSYNMYIADAYNNCIRRIDKTTGIVTTFAGTGVAGFSGDGGPATNAKLNTPNCLCFDDNQNLYITDGVNYRIRKVTPGGIISTVAGNGIAGIGIGSDGVPATSASINPMGIVEANNILYMSNDHSRIFKINLSSGIISYFIGNGLGGHSGDGGPATAAGVRPNYITIDKFGNIFIAESYFHRIRMVNASGYIYTIAGTGTSGYSGDGGPATAAELAFPAGIALDSCGNIYTPEKNSWVVRKITFPKCNYLGTVEQLPSREISIYPNPTSSLLHIQYTTPNTTYQLVNLVGATLHSGTLKEATNTISIQHLPPGIYLLHLTAPNGNRTINKILKE
ncbi:MAG: hypothetical protein K0Q79_1615 [Flavipsychrobacter sp.]|nr:hypothetical protein [Flavipsychrobacter sp.]